MLPQALPPGMVVQCGECKEPAAFGPAGAAWPSCCAAHKRSEMVPVNLDHGCATMVLPEHRLATAIAFAPAAGSLPTRTNHLRSRVSNDVLNFCLVLEEKAKGRFVVDSDALQLAADTLGSKNVVGRPVRWYSELEARIIPSPPSYDSAYQKSGQCVRREKMGSVADDFCLAHCCVQFRDVSLATVLTQAGMRESPASAHAAGAAKFEPGPTQHQQQEGFSGGNAPAAAAADPEASTEAVLRSTLVALAMDCPAPPLPTGLAHHVALVFDPLCAPAARTCLSLKRSLELAFAGARVFAAEDPKEFSGAKAAEAAACVVVYLTRGLLAGTAEGSPAVAAVVAGLRAKRHIVVVYETEADRGGTPSFGDYLAECSAPELQALWGGVTAFPWLADPDFVSVCAVRLLLDRAMDPPIHASASSGGGSAPQQAATTGSQTQQQQQPLGAPAGAGEAPNPVGEKAAAAPWPEEGGAGGGAPVVGRIERALSEILSAVGGASSAGKPGTQPESALTEAQRRLLDQLTAAAAELQKSLVASPVAGGEGAAAPGATSYQPPPQQRPTPPSGPAPPAARGSKLAAAAAAGTTTAPGAGAAGAGPQAARALRTGSASKREGGGGAAAAGSGRGAALATTPAAATAPVPPPPAHRPSRK